MTKEELIDKWEKEELHADNKFKDSLESANFTDQVKWNQNHVIIREFLKDLKKLDVAIVSVEKKCDCGNPPDYRFEGCCSFTCWDEKYG